MGRACRTNGEKKKNACMLLAESQKERDHLEDVDTGGRMIFERDGRGLEWCCMD
jgi:hypothetical protein